MAQPSSFYMGGCQNCGSLLGPLNTRCHIILRTQKGTIISTTTHMSHPKAGQPGMEARLQSRSSSFSQQRHPQQAVATLISWVSSCFSADLPFEGTGMHPDRWGVSQKLRDFCGQRHPVKWPRSQRPSGLCSDRTGYQAFKGP